MHVGSGTGQTAKRSDITKVQPNERNHCQSSSRPESLHISVFKRCGRSLNAARSGGMTDYELTCSQTV